MNFSVQVQHSNSNVTIPTISQLIKQVNQNLFVVKVSPFDIIQHEIPNGKIDGENNCFETKYPFTSNTIFVYLNGLRIGAEDFTILSNQSFSLSDPPDTNDILSVDYYK